MLLVILPLLLSLLGVNMWWSLLGVAPGPAAARVAHRSDRVSAGDRRYWPSRWERPLNIVFRFTHKLSFTHSEKQIPTIQGWWVASGRFV